VTACDDGLGRVWDAATGERMGPTLGHQGELRCAVFGPDGRRLLTAALDGTARLWLGAPNPRGPLAWTDGPVLRHRGPVRHAAFSPDGRRVVSGSWDKTARVWDAATGRPLTAPLQHEGYVDHVAFSPDGRLVLTASWDGTARVWDASTGRPVLPPLRHTVLRGFDALRR
jgi:WD40 repeat protein